MMSTNNRPNQRLVPRLIAGAGLLLAGPALVAQTPAQAPAPSRGTLHLQIGPAGGTVITPTTGARGPAFTTGLGGAQAAFPPPRTLGRTPLRLPPPPPTTPPVEVGPPPFIVLPPLRERRGTVVVQPPLVYPAYSYPQTYATPQVVQVQQPVLVPAAAVPATEPEPLTGVDLAEAYLHWDEPERAVALYQEHLAENPDDAGAIRMLGLSLIDAGRIQEGVATLALAYEQAPDLARNPVPRDAFGPADDLRRNLNRVSVYANRVNSASAWLALAVLMQAEGRNRPAANMLNRAERVGLDAEVVTALRGVVGSPR